MNYNDIVTLISTVGFPIVMCGALFWYVVKSNQGHKEEMDALKDALNANTLAITKLTDKLDSKEVI